MSSLRQVLAFSLTLLMVVTPFLFHGVSWAQEVTTLTTSAADATIDHANPTTNFGSGASLGTAGGAVTVVQRSVVRFDLSTLTNQGVAVKAATLTMTLTDPPGGSRTIEVRNLTTPFTEGTVTWNQASSGTPWSSAGGDFGVSLVTAASSTTRGSAIAWADTVGALAAAVQGWFTNNTGFLLKDATETTNSLPAIAVAETVTGTTNAATTVTSGTITGTGTGVEGNFYVAAIASDGGRVVQSVTTTVTGLTWTAIAGQTSDDFQNRVEIWKATGTPTASGTVTAHFATSGAESIIVSRYTGVNPDSPTGAEAQNTTSGSATTTPNLTFTTTTNNSVPIGAIAEVSATATPGAGYTEDGDTGPVTEGVELEHHTAAVSPPQIVTVFSTLSSAQRWAIIAEELKQEMAPRWGSRESTGSTPTLALNYDRAPTGMTMVPDTTGGLPGVSEVTVSWGFGGGGCSNNNTYRGSYFTQNINGGAGSATSPIADGNGAPDAGRVGSTSEVVIFQQNGGSPCATTLSVENGFNAAQGSSATGGDVIVLPGQSNSFTGFAFDNQTYGTAAGPNHYSNGVVVTGTTNSGGGTTKLWSYKTGATTFAAPGLTASGVIVTAGNDNKLHSMSDSTGQRDYLPGTVVGTDPGALGGTVQSRPPVIPSADLESSNPCSTTNNNCDVAYVGAGDGRVYAFRTDTGAQLWQSAVLLAGASIQGAAAVQLQAFSTGLAHDTVIVGTHCDSCGNNAFNAANNAIVALRGDTGAELWRCNVTLPASFACGNMDIISSTPVIDYATNNVWVTSRSNAGAQPSVWRLDTTNGHKVAGITLAGGNSTDVDASPTLSYNNNAGASSPPAFLYVMTGASAAQGDLRVVDPSNNTVAAAITLTGSGVANGFALPFFDGTVAGCDDIYFATGGTTKGVHRRTFNRSTKTFGASPCNFANNSWDRTATIGATPSNPIDNGFPSPTALYFGSGDGLIHKIKTSDGTDAAGTASVTVNAGSQLGDISVDGIKNQLYIGDLAGRIYAFQSF